MPPDSSDAAATAPARGYSALFRTREFTPLFVAAAFQAMASTVAGLALGTLVYRATESPLLSALSMFGPSLVQMVGAATLLSAADRLPPRATIAGIASVFGVGTAFLALPGLPVWAVFAVILGLGLVNSLGGGVRWGLLNEILSKDGYLLGRSVFNMLSGVAQVTGFAAGGVLVALLSPRVTLLSAAALYLAGAAAVRLGLSRRAPRVSGRPSIAQTWRTNARLWAYAPRRNVYLLLWIPNGLIVGCESLFVSYAPDRAGLLFASAAFGMFVGDVTAGRFLPPALRPRLGGPFLVLLAGPYLLFFLHPGAGAAAACAAVASVGFGASLIQQERLMSLTPDELSGHALGLHSSGMLTMQGVSAALAGTLAQLTSAGTAMTLMAAASLTVTAAVSAADRGRRRNAQREGTAGSGAADAIAADVTAADVTAAGGSSGGSGSGGSARRPPADRS
ncbi:MFS transporter [Streptomyces sp. NPDC008313]|uniref:MFS transporter n=1 Tax=Streptomyces sp. NPDC008313 TaxID=3364826 RepID=UPI0036E3281F